VRVRFGEGRVQLEVEDHGVGFEGVNGQGLGLVAMRERAEILRGRLEVRRPDGGGTLVTLEAPLG